MAESRVLQGEGHTLTVGRSAYVGLVQPKKANVIL